MGSAEKSKKRNMERYTLSQTGKTFLVAALIVGLLIGVGIGWVAKPIPEPVGMVPKSEYDALQSQLDAVTDDLDEANSELVIVTADRDAKAVDLEATLAEVEGLVRALLGAGGEAPIESSVTGEIQLGGLFAFSGPLATFGENEYAAALLAVDHVNAFLKSVGAEWTVSIVAEDTQVQPDLALEKLESLAARGIKLVMGPLASSEVRAIKGYCDSNKILAISQSSTAPDLAIADDYIFRFCPTDKLGQGPAMGRIMYEAGIEYVIPVTRNDAWGVGLEEAARPKFEGLGGTFLEGIRYPDTAVEFSAEASDLATKVASAVDAYGADNVAVWHISFEEVNAFFTAASEYPVLRTVEWFGSDGTAQSGTMLDDPVVWEFAIEVGYPCTIFAPTQSAKWELVRQNGIDVIGREPDSYSYAIYDIVWAYALSILKADSADPDAVRAVLPEVTESFFGASGWIDLDEAGDRRAGDYFIWQITEAGWELAGTYVLATDSVEWE